MIRKIEAMHEHYGITENEKCKTWCNLIKGKYHGQTLTKCRAYGLTHSQATDWKQSNIACGLYNQPFNPQNRPLIEVLKNVPRPKEMEILDGQLDLLNE